MFRLHFIVAKYCAGSLCPIGFVYIVNEGIPIDQVDVFHQCTSVWKIFHFPLRAYEWVLTAVLSLRSSKAILCRYGYGKIQFPNMVLDKCPATFGNLFAVRRQADKQFSFYRPIDLVFYGKNVELERWTRKWSIEVTFYGGRTAIPGRHHRSIEWQCTFSAPQVHRGVRIYHVGFVVEMSLSCIFSSWPWSIIFPMKAA